MSTGGPRDAPRNSRRIWFRLAALLLAVSPLVCLELLCRAAGWGAADLTVDPFVGFTAVRPLFRLTPDGQEYRTAAERLRYFREDGFAARKPPGEFRIFVFGGSTVQGHPFSTETSFPTFLRHMLETARPEQRWKVINCGGVSYASYRLLPIAAECLDYHPDLFLFCSGQNEFLEDVAYGRQRQAAPLLAPLWSLAEQLQSFRAAVRLVHGKGQPANSTLLIDSSVRPLLPTEVQALLDQDGGLDRYHRDDLHAEAVATHFGKNVQRLIQLCRQRGVPLLVIQPPVNLSDCPPFKSAFSESTTAEQQQEILEGLREAARRAASDLPGAIQLAEQMTLTDPRCATSWYESGQLLLTAGRWQEAAGAFQRAVDEDLCPLRMTGPLQQVLRDVVSHERAEFLDSQALLAARCRGGILGEQLLVDHVHPSFRGHEDIAAAIAEWMQARGFLQATGQDWLDAARERCRLSVQELDDAYFLQGRRRLQVLRNWSAGRALLPDLAPATDATPTSDYGSMAPEEQP